MPSANAAAVSSWQRFLRSDQAKIILLGCFFCGWHVCFVDKAIQIHEETVQNNNNAVPLVAPSPGRRRMSDSRSRRGRSSSASSYSDKPTCINDPSQIPQRWKYPRGLSFPDSPEEWTKDEQALALSAGNKAMDELLDFYHSISQERLLDIGTDALSSVADFCLGSASEPVFHKKACEGGAFVAKGLLKDDNEKKNKEAFDWSSTTCEDTHSKAKKLLYLNYLAKELPQDKELQKLLDRLVNFMQATLNDCGTLNHYLDVQSWEADLRTLQTPRVTIRHYVHRSNVLTDLYNVPHLDLGPLKHEMDRFTATLWKYLGDYRYMNARDVRRGFEDSRARHHAYLVTHIAYMPSGFGRHALTDVPEAPWLYRYIRENYYAAMEEGDLDLFAEFIDILRSYGCSEENDVMVRHGTRFMLDQYAKEGYTWMKEKDYPAKLRPDDYDLIHLPWTAAAGVFRCGNGDPVVPGSFGYAFQEALERGTNTNEVQQILRRRAKK